MKNSVNNELEASGYATVSEEKFRIRQRALALRGGLDEETRQEFSHTIGNKFLQLDLLANARIIHTYLSFGTEVNTKGILGAASALGKRIATSVVIPASGELLHAELTPDTRIAPGKLGIPTPLDAPTVETTELGLTATDVVIIPIVAFDHWCNRLGYGKGYYDRFLSKTPAIRVGLAFSCQEVPQIPTEPHDALLDMILTEIGTFG